MEQTFVIILISVIGFIFYVTFKLLYNRYIRSYDNSIDKYLISNGLKLIEILNPDREDWAKSPFEKPSSVKISFVQIRVLGIMIDPSDSKYKVIIASDKNDSITKVWMKIDTVFMAKTRVEFKIEHY